MNKLLINKLLPAFALAFLNLLPLGVSAQVPAAAPNSLGAKGPLLNALNVVPYPGFVQILKDMQAMAEQDEPTAKFVSRKKDNVQLHIDKGTGQVAFVIIEGSVKFSDLAMTRLFKRGTLDKIESLNCCKSGVR